MEIWEANSISAAYTPHPCDVTGPCKCAGDECGSPSQYSGVCGPDGCDLNSYRQGDHDFYGPGKVVDTTKEFTVVTQFITDNGTATGNLSEIRRFYVQNGVVIQNSVSKIAGIPAVDSIAQAYCDAQKSVFGDTTSFQNHGGLTAMGESLARSDVLFLSDGCFRGTCPITSGAPPRVEVSVSNVFVIYPNIRVSDIGSNDSFIPSSSTTTVKSSNTTTTSTATSKSSTATSTTKKQQLDHDYHDCSRGPTNCESPYTCVYQNPWYPQCM
ncbi:hypothetical protein M407DRAFT_24303 [Tulasnella calospora MUT 4182]|uniref:cellulose 1,4-beta-cellobiosidase (non-reducing end) n=1 Tax=Tulasnella calospora MUT 4182 TaxID=1051891 RepID=A0A0C3LYE0_9AGAM|nr:hypothetical protein M407DRAFT_24303 [Tulasnella calospora MUT 4182]